MKKYSLEIENTGHDTYILMSRGHHDFVDFMKAVSEYKNWPMGFPEHVWYKAVPCNVEELGFTCFYRIVPKGTRGAFPATVTHEAYGEDRYTTSNKITIGR